MKRVLPLAILLFVSVLSQSFCAQNERVIRIADEKKWAAPRVLELPFDLPDISNGQQVRLSAYIRNDAPAYYGGFAQWLGVSINGASVLGPDLLNKRLDTFCKNGVDTSWILGTKWTIIYAPDFSDSPTAEPNPWSFYPEDEPYHFVWDITQHVKPGRNVISFDNPKIVDSITTMVLKDVRVEVGTPIKPKSSIMQVTTSGGRLPTCVPLAKNPPVHMKVSLSPSGSIRVGVAGRTFDVTSTTSEPNGKWITTGGKPVTSLAVGETAGAEWIGTGYKVERAVTLCNDHIQVADTFTNTSDKVVGIIYRNGMDLSKYGESKVYLGGWPRFAPTQSTERPAHPSAIAEMDGLTIGMFAEDDIFRVHIKSFAEPGVIGISDPHLGIGPGKSHALEWSIYPVVKGDYWSIINAVRRNWGSNYEIPGPFTIDGEVGRSIRSTEAVDKWIRSRGIKWVCGGQTEYLGEDELQKYGGEHHCNQAEGTAIPLAKTWRRNLADWVKKVHATNPDVKTMTYLHTEICTEWNGDKLYPDSRLYNADGKLVTAIYPFPVYMYVPTLENSYGKALKKMVEDIITETDLDGFFNDQFNYGEYVAYGYNLPWDGCSLDIDQKTHSITRQSSSICLMQLPWKAWMVKYLHDRNKVILANDSIYTRTMLRMQVPAFTETFSYSNLIDCQLACPLGLGNHDQDYTTPQSMARMCRHMLDQGSLLATYTWPDEPKSKPFIDYMHPITPMEIRPGMILGKERIITNRSGRYGWPDGSSAEVYEFDENGQLVSKPVVKQINDKGQVLTELRMPDNHFAVLVRK